MVQEIITYIVIVLAVIIAVRKIIEGFVWKTKKSYAGSAKIKGKKAAGGFGCFGCTSKCSLYKECRESKI